MEFLLTILGVILLPFLPLMVAFLPIIIAYTRGVKVKSIALLSLVPIVIDYFLFFLLSNSYGEFTVSILALLVVIFIPFFLWALIRSLTLKKEGTKITNEDTLENIENRVKKAKLLKELKELEQQMSASNDKESKLE